MAEAKVTRGNTITLSVERMPDGEHPPLAPDMCGHSSTTIGTGKASTWRYTGPRLSDEPVVLADEHSTVEQAVAV